MLCIKKYIWSSVLIILKDFKTKKTLRLFLNQIDFPIHFLIFV